MVTRLACRRHRLPVRRARPGCRRRQSSACTVKRGPASARQQSWGRSHSAHDGALRSQVSCVREREKGVRHARVVIGSQSGRCTGANRHRLLAET